MLQEASEFPAARDDGVLALPRPAVFTRFTLPRLRPLAMRPTYGSVALCVLVASCAAVVVVSSAIPTDLVKKSRLLFPEWMAGPLHDLFQGPLHELIGRGGFSWDFGYAFSGVFVLMLIAYVVTLACARTLSMRAIVIALGVMYALILIGPQLELSDIFNYLAYARLGALHGLNPYTHVIANERFDPVWYFVSWHHWRSPYGPLFTLATYPVGGLSLSEGYWVMKVAMVALSAGFAALVWQCARQLGHDPRYALVFVAANPIVLIYEIGGFHNDPVMLVPAMAAISLLLARRYRWAGALLALAVAAKFTAILLLPFLMIAARPARRSRQVLAGAVLAGIPLALASATVFGFALPNAADQSALVTPLSVVNLVGVVFGFGGTTATLQIASKVGLILVTATLVILTVRRGRPDWLSGAGWATLTLLLCMSWLMPWYVIWALPLAGLSVSRQLRRATLVFTAFAALSFLPLTSAILRDLHIHMMQGHADRMANARLAKVMH